MLLTDSIMSETESQVVKTTKRRTRKTAAAKTAKTAAKTTKKRVRRVKKTKAPVVEETGAPVETVETTNETVTETVAASSAPAQTEQVSASSTQETTTESSTTSAASQLNQNVQTVNETFEQLNTLVETLLKTVHSSGFAQRELRVVNKSYKNSLKNLQKVADEILAQSLKRGEDVQKLLNKRTRKNKGKSNPNSGIQKSHPAHAHLAAFMGMQEGDPVSRVDALKAISAYVREHDLQVPNNRRTFYLKGDLHTLFPDRETMGYTQIMASIGPFFNKSQ
jgi:chromatin remodeling complex protein RSC6